MGISEIIARRFGMASSVLHPIHLVVFAIILIFPWTGMAGSQAGVPREYQVKAVFLFNFAQFVDWPATAFSGPDAPLKLCVLGDDPFGPALQEAVRGETIGNRRLEAQHSRRIEDLMNCQMLFISKSEEDHIGEILAELDPMAILTVSEVEGFARRGGNINFYLEENKVRFEINPDTAQNRGIKMNAQLLSLGKIVRR